MTKTELARCIVQHNESLVDLPVFDDPRVRRLVKKHTLQELTTMHDSSCVLVTYKGFNPDMTCRGFQYEIGKTYTHEGYVYPCQVGFHACEDPLDVFSYYPPATSIYGETRQSGVLKRHSDESKVVSSVINVVRSVSLADIITRGVAYRIGGVKQVVSDTASGYNGAAQASGGNGAAQASGPYGAAQASGPYGAAQASGDNGVAQASGLYGAAQASGLSGVAQASGKYGKVRGADGCALFLLYRALNTLEIAHVWAGIVGQGGIKPDTWYCLDANGQPKEAA